MPTTRSYSRILLHLVLFLVLAAAPDLTYGAEQDSLAYIFRQDNLSSNHDLQLNYELGLPRSTLLISDVIHYKVFDFESSTTRGDQYSIEHRLRSDWNWGQRWAKSIRMESSQYEDHRTNLAANINNFALLGGFKREDRFSLFWGGRSVERYGIVDQGWTTEVNLNEAWQVGPQRSSVQISGVRDQLAEHLNHSLGAKADYSIRFGKISTFQTTLRRETHMQSFFTDSLGSSQSRYNENLQWQNRFTYYLRRDLKLFHTLNWREQLTEIDQEKVDLTTSTKIPGEARERFALMNETGLELVRPHFTSLSTFKVENSQNKYYIDYTQVLYQARETLIWQLPGIVDSVAWVTNLSRLEYDTPDTTNDDDRDEWRLNTEMHFVWQPSPFYYLDLGSKISLFHLIYLFDSRSAENHWNRNLVLWSGFKWQRQAWEGESRARIRSNYFDYDYDDLFIEMDQPSRSFVHRSLDIQQQLSYKLNHRWSMTSKIVAHWEDEGQLDWSAFVQQVSSDREQLEIILKLFYDYRGWKGWVGYLTHERTTKYSLLTRETERWRGDGPLIGARHRLGNRLYFDADARFISVKDQDREYLLPKVYVTLVYR